MSSQVGTMVGGAFPEEAQVGQEIPSGPLPQVVRSVTQHLSKASPGAYRPCRLINMTYFTYLCMC
jgi:hypothetical protein